MKNVRIGDILIEYGYITADQLDKALAYQKEHPELRIGQALKALGFVSEKQVLEALAKRLGLRTVDFAALTVDDRAVQDCVDVIRGSWKARNVKNSDDIMQYRKYLQEKKGLGG